MRGEFRTLQENEFEQYARLVGTCLGSEPGEQEVADWRSLTDLERTLGFFGGSELLAGGATRHVQLTVPGGGTLPVGGVSGVAVQPSHRRLGILRSMVHLQFEDCTRRRESALILFASEGWIYGRFGYGCGTFEGSLLVNNVAPDDVARPIEPGGVHPVSPTEVSAIAPLVHETARLQQPGDIARSKKWWNVWVRDRPYHRHGLGRRLHAVHIDGQGNPDGYVAYRFSPSTGDVDHGHELHVVDLAAATPRAEAALWHFLLSSRLATRMRVERSATDTPLRWLLTNPRMVRIASLTDGLWVRLLDVSAALTARRYGITGRLVLRVQDERYPGGNGTYLLTGGPRGAECSRTTRVPDVALSISALSAMYLGGVSAATLARAGLLEGYRSGSLEMLGAMFRGDPIPFCRTRF